MTDFQTVLESKSRDLRLHRFIAGGTFLASMILYLISIAPTTSFWDCGEFIACSFSLGVPHPPGAPFYLLLGRFFAMIPFVHDVGLRVNFLSALVSALTVMFTYLIIVRLIRKWRGFEEEVSDKVIVYGSGFIGAMAFAASHSFWWNAVEAEVYAISMFFTALVIWLAVKWMDSSEHKSSLKYLLLIAYFVGLATGVHLLNILALSPIVLLIYFQKYKFTGKGVVIALAISLFAILIVYPGVVAGVPKILDGGGIFLLLVFILVGLGGLVWSIRNHHHIVSLVLSSVFLVLIGYSTYTLIFIRSNLDPEINENQPDTIPRLISYLNREQYGASGPVELIDASPAFQTRLQQMGAKIIPIGGNKVLRFNVFERQAPLWEYQFKKMYFRYLSWQFFIGELGQPLIFPFLIGLFGMLWHFMRDWKRGSFVFLLFIMTGIAIVVYLNQPDPQPRERDYAYVGSFFAFALWIGIGVAAIFEMVEDALKKKGEGARKAVSIGLVALSAVVVPVNMLVQNYHSHDRTGNYVAWDYSHNLLETCAPNAILFTNGDNDTFPLWYLQVVEGIRKDVRVVNLSLLNTNWYIKQLKNKDPKLPIKFEDSFIDEKLAAQNDQSLLMRYWPPDGDQNWEVNRPEGGKMTWRVPASLYVNTGQPGEKPGVPNFLRVQDVMILHLIEECKWDIPIYFAVTVSSSNLLGLQQYLSMEGLAFRLHPRKSPPVDRVALQRNMFETYAENYRNLDNPDVYLFDNVVKLLQNYRSGFIQLVYEYYQEIDPNGLQAPSGVPEEQWEDRFDELTPREKALYTLRKMEEVIPKDVVPLQSKEILLQLGRIYSDLGADEEGQLYLDEVSKSSGDNIDQKLQSAFYQYEYGNNVEGMQKIIDEVLAQNPNVDQLFNITAIYDRAQMVDEMKKMLNKISKAPNLTQKQNLDLAHYLVTAGELDRAEKIYLQLGEQTPNDGNILGGLLEVYRTRQDTQKTVELLQTWVSNNPGDTRAKELLEEWKTP
ncbi:DUF2723 domain-containing protein [bacterium]|nr:DUF2723 domain-containing protein [bacterium]